MITPWSWTTSNGDATDAQTQSAYAAITGNGLTTGFSYKVWNDLVDKIKEVTDELRRGWQTKYLTYTGTRMNILSKNLTAEKFNSAVLNVCYLWWSWALDPTQQGYVGRTEFYGIAHSGDYAADFVYGRYFLELTNRLNLMIGIINGTGQLSEADAVGLEIGEFIAEASLIETLDLVTNSVTEIVSNADITNAPRVSLATLDRLSSSIKAEMELSDFEDGIQAFGFQALRFVETLRVLLTAPMDVQGRSPLGGTANMENPETRPMESNAVSHIEGDKEATVDPSSSMKTNAVAENNNAAEAANLRSKKMKVSERQTIAGEQILQADHSASFDWTTLVSILHTDNEITMVNALWAYMEKNLHLILSLFVKVTLQRSLRLTITGGGQATDTATMQKDPMVQFNAQGGGAEVGSATARLDEPLPFTGTAAQRGEGSGTLAKRKSIRFSGLLSFISSLYAEMTMEYSKIAYLESITALAQIANAALHTAGSTILEKQEEMSIQVLAGISGMVSSTIDVLCIELLTAGADIITCETARVENKTESELSVLADFEAKRITNILVYNLVNVRFSPLAELERPFFLTAFATDSLSENAEMENTEPASFTTSERVAMMAGALITLRNEILPSYAEVVHLLNAEGTAGLLDVSHAMSAEVIASLGITAEPDHCYYASIGARVASNMTLDALLEYITSWDYPVQEGTDLTIRQVKKTEQFGGSLYLDVGATVLELQSVLAIMANMAFRYRQDGSLRLISFTVAESGTMDVMQAGAWIYPVKKNIDELSIRQVFVATQNDYRLEVE